MRNKKKLTKLLILAKVNAPIEHIKNDLKQKKETFVKQRVIKNNVGQPYLMIKTKWVKRYHSFRDYINETDEFGNTALDYLIMNGDIEKVKLLTDESTRIDYYKLFTNKLDFEKKSLKFHKDLHDIYKKRQISIYNDWGKYLRETMYYGSLIKKIIEKTPKDVALFYLNDFKKTMYKVSKTYYNKNIFFKELKKVLNARDISGKTLLGTIVNKNYGKEFLDILVELGIDINKKYSNKLSSGKDIKYKMGDDTTYLPFILKNNTGVYSDVFNNKEENKEKYNEVKKKIKRYEYDEYPIHQALRKGSINTLEALLSYQTIKEKIKDKNGLTLEDKGYKIPNKIKTFDNKAAYNKFEAYSNYMEDIGEDIPF